MTDLEYMDLAESLLERVELDCDRLSEQSDLDIDSLRSGGAVTVILPGRSQIVINLQKPLHEIWMAALSGGFHFRYDGGQWRDTKTAEDFFQCLTRLADEQCGLNLVFGR